MNGLTEMRSTIDSEQYVNRRRAALKAAGVDHGAVADTIGVARQSVTGVINGDFTSADFQIERQIVDTLVERFGEIGDLFWERHCTLSYMGWPDAKRA